MFNFRSEGRSFAKSNRCLIPASAFFEFTGKRYPKSKHRFALRDVPFMATAGVWREGKADGSPAFAMLTTEPGPGVAPYHDRQVVVLKPSNWVHWIYSRARSRSSCARCLPHRSPSRLCGQAAIARPADAAACLGIPRAPVAARCGRSAPLAQPFALLRNRQFSETIWNAAAQAVMSRAGQYALPWGVETPTSGWCRLIRHRTP